MFEQKPKPQQKPGQKPSATQETGPSKPKLVPIRPASKNTAGTTTSTRTSAKKPPVTSTPQHAVYRPPAVPVQGTTAPKPLAGDLMRARIGVFKDKETRQALYSVYAVIRAAEDINPKQAQEALKVFQQQTLKDKDLTAEKARKLARTLSVGFTAQAGSQGAVLDGGSPNLTGRAYQERMLASYNVLTGDKKNTVLPGVGAFFDNRMPPLTKEQQAIFGSMAGAGPGLAGISGKVASGVVGAVFKNNVSKPTQGQTGQPASSGNTVSTLTGFSRNYRGIPKPEGIGNPTLKNIVRSLYKPGVWGDGSTQGGMRMERTMGNLPLPGRTTTHANKIDQSITALENVLAGKGKNKPGYVPLTSSERQVAQNLLDDLKAARQTAQLLGKENKK